MIQIPLNIQIEDEMLFFFCGYERTPPDLSRGPSVWDYYLIHNVHAGEGFIRTNNEEYLIRSGEGFIIYPNVVSHYFTEKSNPWEYSWIAIKGKGIEKILYQTSISPFQNKFKHQNFDFFKFFSIEHQNAIRFDASNILLLKSNFYAFLSHIMVLNSKEVDRSLKDSKNVYIKAVENIVNTNFHNRISIEQISKQIGLDISYLGKLFKDEKGISIKNYLTNVRIKKACELLKNTNYQISDISRSLGYSDQLQFSKIFKKYKLVSPSKFRHQNKVTVQK